MSKKKVVALPDAGAEKQKRKPAPMSPEKRAMMAEKARKQWADANSKLRVRQFASTVERRIKPPKDAVERIEYCVGNYGSTKEQLAAHFGICLDTFNDWIIRHPEIRAAFERSKGIEYSKLVGMLYEKAMAGDSVCAMFLLKVRHNARDSGPIPGEVGDPTAKAAKIREFLKEMEKRVGDD